MLPSTAQTEQTIFEKQNPIKVPKGTTDDKSSDEVESGEESESDNEDIVDVIEKGGDININTEFEKLAPFKFKRLSEESSDEVDQEIAEILHEAKPLGNEVQTEVEKSQFSLKAITPEVEPNSEVENSRFNVQAVNEDAKPLPVAELNVSDETVDDDTSTPICELKELATDKPTSLADKISEHEELKSSVSDLNANKTVIDDEPLPKTPDESVKEGADERPPVPIPTYLWEDVKRSKEQVSGDNVCTSISAPSTSLIFSND